MIDFCQKVNNLVNSGEIFLFLSAFRLVLVKTVWLVNNPVSVQFSIAGANDGPNILTSGYDVKTIRNRGVD